MHRRRPGGAAGDRTCRRGHRRRASSGAAASCTPVPGTSGRLAMLDAVECVPTFGVPPTLVVRARRGWPERADLERRGRRGRRRRGRGGRHPPWGGRGRCARRRGRERPDARTSSRRSVAARERGALTVAIADSPGSPMAALADHAIELDTGPEVVAGSTRLKAGTAQKLALNMISTAVAGPTRPGLRQPDDRRRGHEREAAPPRDRDRPRRRRHRRRDRGAPSRRLRPRGQDRGPHGPPRPSPPTRRASGCERAVGTSERRSTAPERRLGSPSRSALERLGACYCRRPNQASRGGRR